MVFNIFENVESGIYTINNSIDSRFYIGSTVNFYKRFRDHKYKLSKGIHANKYIQAFVNKYGIDKLSFNLLYPCKISCLVYNEKLWIETLKPQFNLKKIINRPKHADEIKYEEEQYLNSLKNIKTPLSYLIDEMGIDWWNDVIKNSIVMTPEEEREFEKRVFKKKSFSKISSKGDRLKHLMKELRKP